MSRPTFSTPAFFPVTRFHSLMHRSLLLTLIISSMLGCMAKSLTPEGTPQEAAVSPLGRPRALGIGALILESRDQSRVLVTATVESSDEDRSFDRVGKASF